VSRIERIYIATHRGDLRLTRICVASVRHWYPDIPIFLLKDFAGGDFSTNEIEERWNVEVWPTEGRSFGWGFIKLEPLFAPERARYLVLDSDIVFIGRVIDVLETFDEDFVVQEEVQPANKVPGLYFDAAAIRESLDPSFVGPAFTFNTGQYVATTGVLKREDFKGLIRWSEPRAVLHPALFNPSDQGVLNYAVLEQLKNGRTTVARTPFMKWGIAEMKAFDVALLNQTSPYPYLIHWAGLKKRRIRQMPRADILQHFERAYYEKLPYGEPQRLFRSAADEWMHWQRRAAKLALKLAVLAGLTARHQH
jgi:hypothetical protein